MANFDCKKIKCAILEMVNKKSLRQITLFSKFFIFFLPLLLNLSDQKKYKLKFLVVIKIINTKLVLLIFSKLLIINIDN